MGLPYVCIFFFILSVEMRGSLSNFISSCMDCLVSFLTDLCFVVTECRNYGLKERKGFKILVSILWLLQVILIFGYKDFYPYHYWEDSTYILPIIFSLLLIMQFYLRYLQLSMKHVNKWTLSTQQIIEFRVSDQLREELLREFLSKGNDRI